ncbi:MAG: DUF1192 domain-containing protein [Alphaproteobacteria bacterium]|nr:DUF1192 domain-containing protein [Alphaproteobacteria bacterium]
MAIDPEELLPRPSPREIVLGQDLSTWSEHELVARIASLEAEIARCRDAIVARKATREAASAVFKTR